MEDESLVANTLFDERRFSEAFEKYRILAEAGSVGAQLRVAWMLETGCGIVSNPEEARRWYFKAAEGNSPEGEFYLGRLHRADKLYQAALNCFHNSADQNYMPSIYQLGVMYELGEGTEINKDTAFKYYERAAIMGHLRAQREMAMMLIKGHAGFKRIPDGVLMLLRFLRDGIRAVLKDPDSDKIRW